MPTIEDILARLVLQNCYQLSTLGLLDHYAGLHLFDTDFGSTIDVGPVIIDLLLPLPQILDISLVVYSLTPEQFSVEISASLASTVGRP